MRRPLIVVGTGWLDESWVVLDWVETNMVASLAFLEAHLPGSNVHLFGDLPACGFVFKNKNMYSE
jgi:hypothetical protein